MEPILNSHNKAEYEPAHTAEHLLNAYMVKHFGCQCKDYERNVQVGAFLDVLPKIDVVLLQRTSQRSLPISFRNSRIVFRFAKKASVMKQTTISLLFLLSLLTFSCKKEQNPDGQYYSIGMAIWTFPGDLYSDTPGEYYVKEISQYYLNQNGLGDVLQFANASSITLSGSIIPDLADVELSFLTFPQKYCLIANKMVILNKDLSHVSSKGLSHIDSLMFDGAVLKFNGSLSISSVSDLSGFPLICDIIYPKRYTDRSSAIKDTTSLSSSGKYKFKDLPIRRLDLSSIKSPIKFTDTFEIKKNMDRH